MWDALRSGRSALIKINLARTPLPGHPRTDNGLLTALVRLITAADARCAIAECAGGLLAENLRAIGLGGVLEQPGVRCIDLDLEEAEEVVIHGESHYIPRCLRDYAVRIALPVASKRLDMLFSNNVKLFVGAVPGVIIS